MLNSKLLIFVLLAQPAVLLAKAQSNSNTVEYQPFYDLVYSEKYPPDKDKHFSEADKNTFIQVLSNKGRSNEEGIKASGETQIPAESNSGAATVNAQAADQSNIPNIAYQPTSNIPNIAYQPTNHNLTGTHIYRYAPYKLDSPPPKLARTSSPPQPVQTSRQPSSPHPVQTSRPFFYGTPFYWLFPQLRMDDVHEMWDLLKTAVYDFLDVPLIRSVIDLYYDGITPRGRIDIDAVPEKTENEGIRRFLTTLISGFLGKEECWERLNCKMGELLSDVQGKNIFFKLAGKLMPPRWSRLRSSLELVEEGSNNNAYCVAFKCRDSRITLEVN